ncbi:MAG: hypothetical protein LH472_13735 [Pyrinomonadaceae bacterium]|nr:hypothetical protein [Pyrinomonadaceae bacterium]
MKTLTETGALHDLQKLKSDYQNFIKENYEHHAASCETCPTKGACCLDAHFVNVHISKLEAVAIRKTLSKLNEKKQHEIYARVTETVEKYDLKSDGNSFAKTFACPLFEKNVGCLVHENGKPAPCISHACYENKEDLPPDNLQATVENKIQRLNRRTYGNRWNYLALPVWLDSINPFKN